MWFSHSWIIYFHVILRTIHFFHMVFTHDSFLSTDEFYAWLVAFRVWFFFTRDSFFFLHVIFKHDFHVLIQHSQHCAQYRHVNKHPQAWLNAQRVAWTLPVGHNQLLNKHDYTPGQKFSTGIPESITGFCVFPVCFWRLVMVGHFIFFPSVFI